MRISSIFSIFLVVLAASTAGFGQPPGPPPHDMEPPGDVPPSLLELANEMKAVRDSLAATREELHEAIQDEPGSELPGGDDDLWHFRKRAGRMQRNHETFRQLQEFRGEAGRIAGEAWDSLRKLAEARKESGAPPLPPERRKELERWMMATFGPPPQEHGPFPWMSDHMGDGHPGVPGFQGKMLFEKIDRMEKRIEDLEEKVRSQEDEIRELRAALESKRAPSGGAD